MLKKSIIFILCLVPWFLSNLIGLDYSYYETIKTPFFAPPSIFYIISWTITYFLISLTTYSIFTSYQLKQIPKSYKIIILINYLLNQSFTIVFFGLKSTFLGFISCLTTFVSTLFLYEETSLLLSKKAKLLTPYILLTFFASILSITIYLINT